MSRHVEYVEVEFEDENSYLLEPFDGPPIDPEDPRLTQEVLVMDPEADAYGPNFAILRVRTDLLTIAEQR